jgi:GNAT superfamily N-acetyltransferase
MAHFGDNDAVRLRKPAHSETTHVTLRSGEDVELAVIRTPNPVWAERIERMLLHKGEPWNWENTELLRRHTGCDTTFFVLHRDGAPFANIMLMMSGQVGLLGHVWTEPRDRGGGASSVLMDALLRDYRERCGQALFLGTEFDRMPWHYYRRRGFEPVEPGSGYMESYVDSRAAFEDSWFGAVRHTIIEPLDWRHVVAAVPLFLSAGGGAVRVATTRLFGRRISDEALLVHLRDDRERKAGGLPASACVLRDRDGLAVVGFAGWRPDPLWPAIIIVDVFCHPVWWRHAGELIEALRLPADSTAVAYADSNDSVKHSVLAAAGFSLMGRLPRAVSPAPGAAPIDVTLFRRP